MENQKEIWDKLYSQNLKWNLDTKDLPKILKGRIVLELGVGNGKTLKSIISQKPKKVYALDFSLEALKIIKINYPLVQIINSNIVNIPIEDNFFEVVVCYFTLNNLLKKDRKKAVNEINRVLKKGGILLFRDFAKGDFRQKLSQKSIEKNSIINKNGIICHFFNEEELKNLFYNFKSIKIDISRTQPIKNKSYLERRNISLTAKK